MGQGSKDSRRSEDLMATEAVQDLMHWMRVNHHQHGILSDVVRVAMQMEEFGLDKANPETMARAVQIIKNRSEARLASDRKEDARRRQLEAAAAALKRDPAHFVYYVDLYGDAIKIGYSKNVPKRMVDLRRKVEHLLAVEPGGRAIETLRHRQFRGDRRGGLEDFDRSPALLEHIDRIVQQHGDPVLALLGGKAA